MEMFADGVSLGSDSNWKVSTEYAIPGNTRVICVEGIDKGAAFGMLESFGNGMVTNASWKCDNVKFPGWNSSDFDESNWPAVVELAKHGDKRYGVISGIDWTAKWIWTAGKPDNVYCRLRLQ